MILFSLDDDVMMMVQWSITYVQVHKGQQQNNPRPYVALVHLLCVQVRVPNPKYKIQFHKKYTFKHMLSSYRMPYSLTCWVF